jgi:succinate dehydrogenase subunit C
MNNSLSIKLWLIQRLSGMLVGLFVVIHLVTMILTIQGGLTAREILDRTSGNWPLGVFYGLFATGAAVHGSLGLRTVAQEVIGWRGASLNIAVGSFCILLSALGLAAVKGLMQ